MADVERYILDFFDVVTCASEFKQKINSACGGSFEWGIKEVVNSYLSIMNRFCPFGVGDKVQLKNTISPPEGSGWHHCRHFLKKGALATVRSRGYSEGNFTFEVVFDIETHLGKNGEETPVSPKHTFHFSEKYLEPARDEHHFVDAPDPEPVRLPDLKVDDKVLVRGDPEVGWVRRYFSHWKDGGMYCFHGRMASWTAAECFEYWRYWKLPDGRTNCPEEK